MGLLKTQLLLTRSVMLLTVHSSKTTTLSLPGEEGYTHHHHTVWHHLVTERIKSTYRAEAICMDSILKDQEEEARNQSKDGYIPSRFFLSHSLTFNSKDHNPNALSPYHQTHGTSNWRISTWVYLLQEKQMHFEWIFKLGTFLKMPSLPLRMQKAIISHLLKKRKKERK